MSVLILLLLLVILLYISYLSSKGALLSPQFGFAVSFLPQTMLALFYVNKWKLDLCFATIIVVSGGVLLFVICSVIFGYVMKHVKVKQIKNNKDISVNSIIKVEKWKFIILAIIQVATILLCVRYLLSLASGASLLASITYYRYTNLFSEDSFTIPSYIRMLRTFSISSGYVLSYLFIHSLFYKDKTNKLLIVTNIALSLINDLILGARTGLATFAVAFIVQYYFVRGKKYGWKKALPFKTILKIFLFSFVFIGTFQLLAEIMGRTLASSYTFMDYIAGYLSAELHNLDYFLRSGNFGSTIETNQTLNGIIPLLSKIFDQPQWVHNLDIPFVKQGGYNFGNVYTIFYAFIYDFSYFGLFIFIPIMAFICQLFYRKSIKYKNNNSIPLGLIIYSYIYFTIIFSFFSDKFYEFVLNTKFIWTILSWIALKYYFEKHIRLVINR